MSRLAYLAAATFIVASATACTKESRSSQTESSEATPAAGKKDAPAPSRPPIAALPALDLEKAAPKTDRFILLFRFDNLRKHSLAPAAESIIAPLPDYQRVFGARDRKDHGDLIGDVFSSVVLTTRDPTILTATTLAARGAFDDKGMREMLAYEGAGIRWSAGKGGPVGEIFVSPRFGWHEERVFFMPAPEWIVLAQPSELAGLATSLDPINMHAKSSDGPPPKRLPIKPPSQEHRKAWPSWLAQVVETEAQSQKKTPAFGDLLVAANISQLDQMKLPTRMGQLEVPLPKSVTIAAFANGDVVTFRGALQFDEPPTAERFIAVVNAAKLGLKVESVAKQLPPGSAHALASLDLDRRGREVRWMTTATKSETRQMCAFSAAQSRRLLGGHAP